MPCSVGFSLITGSMSMDNQLVDTDLEATDVMVDKIQ